MSAAAAATTTTTPPSLSAIVLGSTGAVGSQILSLLSTHDSFHTVHSFVRRPNNHNPPLSKVHEHLIDFEKLSSGDSEQIQALRNVDADVVFIALGTTRKDAGSAEAFEKIDREYVLKAAEAAKSNTKQGQAQRVVYCSSQAANPTSRFLYTRSKGLTEQGLTKLYPQQTYLFRPGFLLNATRAKPRPLEKYYGYLTHYVLARFSNSVEIDVRHLANGMIWAGLHGQQGLQSKGVVASSASSNSPWIIPNAEALKLADAK